MSKDKRWKQTVSISNFCNCYSCGHYMFDIEDGYLCKKYSKNVNDSGEGIPDWCKLPDVDPFKEVEPRRCATCKNDKCKFYEDRNTSRSLIDNHGRMMSAAVFTSEVGCISYF